MGGMEANIKIHIMELRCCVMTWVEAAYNHVQWWVLMLELLTLWVLYHKIGSSKGELCVL
jgi:hypothetical protein